MIFSGKVWKLECRLCHALFRTPLELVHEVRASYVICPCGARTRAIRLAWDAPHDTLVPRSRMAEFYAAKAARPPIRSISENFEIEFPVINVAALDCPHCDEPLRLVPTKAGPTAHNSIFACPFCEKPIRVELVGEPLNRPR